ncbi:MAG TPA: hypothetical protein VGE07_02740 [Herpetosiphonaceae bacterium]
MSDGAPAAADYKVPTQHQSCLAVVAAYGLMAGMWCVNAFVGMTGGNLFLFDFGTPDQWARLREWMGTPFPVALIVLCWLVNACYFAALFQLWRARKVAIYAALNLAALFIFQNLVWLRIGG